MRVKIISDGIAQNTQVLYQGEQLKGVTSITWHLEAGSIPYAEISMIKMPIEVEAQVKSLKLNWLGAIHRAFVIRMMKIAVWISG